MSIVTLTFNISRAGKVIHENLSLAQVIEGITLKAIFPSDHYWTAGMTDWALVSSRQWAVSPVPTPVPVPTVVAKPIPVPAPVPVSAAVQGAAKPAAVTPSAQPRPVTTPTPPPRQPAEPTLANPIEKGFSPYVTYYRSNDDRWAFGIFGGLAHRNCWPKPLLLLIRILMMITFFPGLAYIGWGFTTMLLTPSLPTSNVRSYYDLNNGKPSQDTTDFKRLIKILVVGLIVLVVVVWFASRRS